MVPRRGSPQPIPIDVSTWVYAVIAAGAALAVLELVRAQRRSAWRDRGIAWRARGAAGALLRLAPAAGAATVCARLGPPAAAAAAASVWLVVLAVDTDSTSLKIPHEPCWATTVIGVLAWSWQPTAQSMVYLAAAATTGMLLYPAVRLGHLPAGDARLIIAMLAATLWWAGTSCLPWALLVVAVWAVHYGAQKIYRPGTPRPARPAAWWIGCSLLLPAAVAVLTKQTVHDLMARTS